jgi:hypothetical protein
MKLRILIAAVFFIIPSLSYLSADVYRWTDSSGKVVFGNRPPSNARDAQVIFREMPAGPEATPSKRPDNSSSVEAIPPEADEEKKGIEEPSAEAGSAAPSAPLSREELIAVERAKIENKIKELEALPLDHFGSQKNKRVRIGYYQYRLENLIADPDDYFSNPEPFEGNIKTPVKNP